MANTVNKKVNCELKVIAYNQLNSSIDDRWIISKNKCFNIPSPDVIARGQYSEVKSTLNRPPFERSNCYTSEKSCSDVRFLISSNIGYFDKRDSFQRL
jgi:hypothetical protein